jgi:hypothetical protein
LIILIKYIKDIVKSYKENGEQFAFSNTRRQKRLRRHIPKTLVFGQELPDALTHTWSYSGFLKGREIEYAKPYIVGERPSKRPVQRP